MVKYFSVIALPLPYLSVIGPGEVSPGSNLAILGRDPNGVTIGDVVRLYLRQARDPELLQRAMNVTSLPEVWKTQLRLSAQGEA
jgi:MOSC domain-containing protein YiiM